jgi:hypothetical protein
MESCRVQSKLDVVVEITILSLGIGIIDHNDLSTRFT